jgi:antitoxin ParD1/3/4
MVTNESGTRGHAEHEIRLVLIRAHIERSLNDPRANLTSKEMRERLDALYARYRKSEQ